MGVHAALAATIYQRYSHGNCALYYAKYALHLRLLYFVYQVQNEVFYVRNIILSAQFCCDDFNIRIDVCMTRMLIFPTDFLQVDETFRLLGLLATMVSMTSAYFCISPKDSCFSLDSTNPNSMEKLRLNVILHAS